MNTANGHTKQFQFALWFAIIVNLLFATPAIIAPQMLVFTLGLSELEQPVWIRNTGMLLVTMIILYIPFLVDPIKLRVFAWLVVLERFIAAGFWFCMMQGLPRIFWGFFIADLIVTLLLLRGWQKLWDEAAASGGREWRRGILSRIIGGFFRLLDKLRSWHRWRRLVGIGQLYGFREDYREKNLHDTGQLPSNQNPIHGAGSGVDYKYNRTVDGSFNDLSAPEMGMRGARFGRNFPLDKVWPYHNRKDLPSPREISRVLMTRDAFKPALTLNLLAGAWIQFMNHGWFNHERDLNHPPHCIALAQDDEWPSKENKVNEMKIPVSKADITRPEGSPGPPTYRNTETHWWDGSQLYGSELSRQKDVRAFKDGKLKIEEDGYLPLDPKVQRGGIDLTGFNDNYWFGLSVLHTLFSREHNYLCDELKSRNPGKNDEWLFQKARLINAAMMAKIHTVEWTPAILAHPVLRIGMEANWWGLLGRIKKKGKRGNILQESEAAWGIIGSSAEHHAAPFALTEEFVAVYRLHPLIPDEVVYRSHENHKEIARVPFLDAQGIHTRAVMEKFGWEDTLYTLGVEHPGALTLHNYPRILQALEKFEGDGTRTIIDLASIDILRDRERGVPRYNDFRELLGMPRCRHFEDITSNREWAAEISRLYKEPDDVDLMVGMFAEDFPRGFGFSDTAFRIFILMASRRLQSDRFFTDFWNAETYTDFGLEHINTNGMAEVLKRHFPSVRPALEGIENTFAPWKKARVG